MSLEERITQVRQALDDYEARGGIPEKLVVSPEPEELMDAADLVSVQRNLGFRVDTAITPGTIEIWKESQHGYLPQEPPCTPPPPTP